MAKFISKKEEKYNADDIANQLISQINNNEVDSSKIKTEEINIRSDKNDYNENKLPEWKPYCDADRYEMNFKTKGASGGNTETARMRFLLER